MIFHGVAFCLGLIATASIAYVKGTPNHPGSKFGQGGTSNSVFDNSNGIFAARWYGIESSKSANFIMSPLSLNYALTAVSEGTDGNSRKQLLSVLNQPDNEQAVLSSYAAFTNSLKGDRNLEIATKLYANNEVPLKKQFISIVTSNFDAGVQNLDFRNTKQATAQINTFVANKTRNLIPKLLDEGQIDPATALVLVNAVYFKSNWEHKFHEELTKRSTFYGYDKNYEVHLMTLFEESFRYGENNDAQLIELPYKNNYSFFVILPKGPRELGNIEREIKSLANNPNRSPFAEIFKDISHRNVIVYLPKFKFEQKHELSGTLQELGATDIFGGSANFNKLTDLPVHLSNAIQKVRISVDEQGTEAAAATGFTLNAVSGKIYPEPPKEFKADHPFIYVIMEKSFRNVLFTGRYSHP